MVRKLLEAGASVDVEDSLGRTALLQSRGPDSMKLGADVYCMCVPPTAGVNRCVDLLRDHMGLPALAVEEREHRVEQPGDVVGVQGGASTAIESAEESPLGSSSSRDVAAKAGTPNNASLSCEVCGGPGKLRCGACKTARYCSAACQKTAWPEHKLVCRRATGAQQAST